MKVQTNTSKKTARVYNKIKNAIIDADYSYIITSEPQQSPLKIKLVTPSGLITEHIIYAANITADTWGKKKRYRAQKNQTLHAFEMESNAWTTFIAYSKEHDFFGVYLGNNFPGPLPIAKSFYFDEESIERCQFERITTARMKANHIVGYVKPEALAPFLERIGACLDNGVTYAPNKKKRKDQGKGNANQSPHRTVRLGNTRANSFSWHVQTAYQNRCVVTGTKGKDVHAAHVADVASGAGNDSVNNGILLHKSVHKKFDKGELVILPDYTWYANPTKSKVIDLSVPREKITLPDNPDQWPKPQFFVEKLKYLGFESLDAINVG